jgi:acetyl-CoA synthetase
MSLKTMSETIWQPTGEYLDCRVVDFMKQQGIADWRELVSRSCSDIEWFWQSALDYMGIVWDGPYEKLLDLSGGFQWAKWFTGGQLNIHKNCLDWHLRKGQTIGSRTSVGSDHPAIIWEGDDGASRKLTYGQLHELAGRVAALLFRLEIKRGDAVGVYMPMVPEVVAVLFGCLKIGAVPVPVFSGFGDAPLAARMADAEAKILFTADVGFRRGKEIPIKPDADRACELVPGLKHVVVLKRSQKETSWVAGRDLDWGQEIENTTATVHGTAALPAEHPSMYLYTSGTTGKPKGTVHTHAGALAQIAKELGFAFDVRPDDVFFWVTDIGWMMGPWEMIGVTFWGGTIVLFEGAPNYPQPDRLWKMIERHRVKTLGISPTVVRVLRPAGDEWLAGSDLSSLRLLGSTGEPWDPDSYMWFFEKAGQSRCPVINISGGTEVVGCLLQPLPVMPLKPCSLGAPGLGMDVDVFDDTGKPIRDTIGHLVCKKPGPSMTKGFLKDPERYLETYFSRFPGVWYHGDWAKVDADGNWFLYGRSDDTIKVAGKRVGPGEVEAILIEHSFVAEAAAIGVPHDIKGETIVCFVVLSPGEKPGDVLAKELLDKVALHLGGPLRPDKLHFVSALPKTRSGKIVRGTIRKKYLNEPLGDLSSVENSEALEAIVSVT